jgi:hypothetical protein
MAAGGQSVHDANPKLARDLKNAIGALLTTAQTAGAVRGDVGVDDVMNLVVGVFGSTAQFGPGRDAAGRLLAIVFDGLRARAPARAPRGRRGTAKRSASH